MLIVSLDAATRQTYESIRKGAHFEQVISNIRRFNSVRNSLAREDRPRLVFRLVLMRSNIEELPEYIRLARSLEVDAISLVHMIVFNRQLERESLIYHRRLANDCLKQARDLIDKFAMQAYEFPPLFSEDLSLDKDENCLISDIPCRFVWSEAFIELNGDVYPCCAPDRSGLLMGNVSRQPFKQIWNGSYYRSLRKSFRGGSLYPPCRDCYQRLKDSNADNYSIYSV
jgi:radical SAM protein with 4Fe4S-binding SPASM domain